MKNHVHSEQLRPCRHHPLPPVKIIKIPGFQGIHNSHLIQWPAVHIRIQAFGIYRPNKKASLFSQGSRAFNHAAPAASKFFVTGLFLKASTAV